MLLAVVGCSLAFTATDAEAQTTYGSSVVGTAESYIGVPYVWGGSSYSGVDCTGLTREVYAQHGVYLPHSVYGQLGYGTPVSSPQPGDLLFFDFGSGIQHAAIYAGNGYMLDSPYPGATVQYRQVYWQYLAAARSI